MKLKFLGRKITAIFIAASLVISLTIPVTALPGPFATDIKFSDFNVCCDGNDLSLNVTDENLAEFLRELFATGEDGKLSAEAIAFINEIFPIDNCLDGCCGEPMQPNNILCLIAHRYIPEVTRMMYICYPRPEPCAEITMIGDECFNCKQWKPGSVRYYIDNVYNCPRC